MGEVIELPKSSGNLACPQCGSEWFSVKGVVFDLERKVIGYAMPVACRGCGRDLNRQNDGHERGTN